VKALGVLLIVVGVGLTGVGLFGQLVLTGDDGHHDGRASGFALESVSGADELIVEVHDDATTHARIERAGQVIVDYDDIHGAAFHLFAVTTSFDGYSHTISDEPSADGSYPVDLTSSASHRVVAQAAPAGGPDLLELGVTAPESGVEGVPPAVYDSDVWTEGDLTVTRQGLDFVLSEPWNGDDHMGAPAFLALFHEGDFAFVHEHAELIGDDRFSFGADLPGLGEYLAAVEFVQDGELVTALFRFEL
jgi:hypothetical protein